MGARPECAEERLSRSRRTRNTVGPAAIAAKAGQENFWKRPPAPPKNVTAQKTNTPGHVQLAWEEPDDDKVRYYNIYYSTKEAPEAEQQNRIASPPVGISKYLDWLAAPNARHFYVVTSVDRQGNESQGISVTCQ